MNRETLAQTSCTRDSDFDSRWNHADIFDMFDDGEYLWFTAIEYNALFKVSKHTFDVEYIGSFPDEETYGYRLYTSINEYNGKLFFTPCTAHEIGVYDMVNRSFEKVSIGISRIDNDLSQIQCAKKFVSGFVCEGTLVLIPCCYDKVVLYDIAAGTVSFQEDLFKHFHAKYHDQTTSLDSQFYLCWFARRVNESEVVFNLHCSKNILIFYNLKTGEFRELAIGSEKGSFSLVEYDGRQVYLYNTPADVLVKWEIETGEYSECRIADQLPEFQSCGLENSFVNMTLLGEWLYLIPANTNVAVKVDTTTLAVAVVEGLSEECTIQREETPYLNLCRVYDDKLYLWGNRSKRLIIYGKDGKLQHVEIKIPEGIEYIILEKRLADLLCNGCSQVEEGTFSLNNFINALTSSEMERKDLLNKK